VNAVVEQDHRIRDVFLQPLTCKKTLAARSPVKAVTPWSFSHRTNRQLRPQDGVVLQARQERFNRGEDDALRADRPNRVVEPDKQPFEIVFAGLFDLATLDADVVDRELLRLDQLGEVKAEGRDVAAISSPFSSNVMSTPGSS